MDWERVWVAARGKFSFLPVLWLKQWSNARARRCPTGRTPKISAGRCSTDKSRPPPSAGGLIGLWDKSAGQIFPALFAAAPRAVSIYPARRPKHRRPREFFSRRGKTSGRIYNSSAPCSPISTPAVVGGSDLANGLLRNVARVRRRPGTRSAQALFQCVVRLRRHLRNLCEHAHEVGS